MPTEITVPIKKPSDPNKALITFSICPSEASFAFAKIKKQLEGPKELQGLSDVQIAIVDLETIPTIRKEFYESVNYTFVQLEKLINVEIKQK